MEGKSVSYVLGMAVGFAVIFLLIRLFKGKLRMANPNDIDERQLLIRGKAWRLCAGVYAAELFVLFMAATLGVELPLTAAASYMTALVIPIGVYAVYCIFHDAYLGLHADRKRFLLLGTVLFLIEAAATLRSVQEGALIVDGRLTDDCLYPLIALLWLVILISLRIRRRQLSQEARE